MPNPHIQSRDALNVEGLSTKDSASPPTVIERSEEPLILPFLMRENFWVYMVTNKTHTVLYVGVTNDLERRVWEHRNKTNPHSFASMYSAHILVWYEHIPTALEAIDAEKRIKGLTREKKNAMIRALNPRWKDLSEGWYD